MKSLGKKIEPHILLSVAQLCVDIKEKRYTDRQLVVPAPDELIRVVKNGVAYLISAGTDWAQEEDRKANFDTSILSCGRYKGFYRGIYEKFERIRSSLLQKPWALKGHVVFGGFSQGGGIAQMLASHFDKEAYCFASVGVSTTKKELQAGIHVINHPKDLVRLFPVGSYYLGNEYFIQKDGLAKESIVRKVLDFLTRKEKFGIISEVHDEAFYLECLQTILKS